MSNNPPMPPCHVCGAPCWRYYVSGPWCEVCYKAAVDEAAKAAKRSGIGAW